MASGRTKSKVTSNAKSPTPVTTAPSTQSERVQSTEAESQLSKLSNDAKSPTSVATTMATQPQSPGLDGQLGKRSSDAKSTTTVAAAMPTESETRRATVDTLISKGYLSPMKRVKRAVDTKPPPKPKVVVQTVDGLKEIVRKYQGTTTSNFASDVVFEARVVWTSFETCETGPVARLHLIDKQVPDCVEDMHKALRDEYEVNKREIDAELATASLYGLDQRSEGILPRDGATITVRRMWALRMFLGRNTQLTTTLDNIIVNSGP